jgi:putative oxidoreductase
VTATDVGILLVRVIVAITLLMHAWNHWFGGGKVAGTGAWFESLGLRPGIVHAWASIAAEIAAGIGIGFGFLTPLACAAAVGTMTVAGVVAHRRNGFFIFRDGYEYVLLIATVSVAVAVMGPGRASVDHALDTVLRGTPGLLVALIGGLGGTALLLGAAWRPGRQEKA